MAILRGSIVCCPVLGYGVCHSANPVLAPPRHPAELRTGGGWCTGYLVSRARQVLSHVKWAATSVDTGQATCLWTWQPWVKVLVPLLMCSAVRSLCRSQSQVRLCPRGPCFWWGVANVAFSGESLQLGWLYQAMLASRGWCLAIGFAVGFMVRGEGKPCSVAQLWQGLCGLTWLPGNYHACTPHCGTDICVMVAGGDGSVAGLAGLQGGGTTWLRLCSLPSSPTQGWPGVGYEEHCTDVPATLAWCPNRIG